MDSIRGVFGSDRAAGLQSLSTSLADLSYEDDFYLDATECDTLGIELT